MPGWEPDDRGFYFHHARAARDNGYLPLIPIMPGKKGCFVKEWPKWRYSPPTDEEIRGWIKDNPYLGFGYAHNHQLVAFDIDVNDSDLVHERLSWLHDNIWGEHTPNKGNQPMYRIGNAPKVMAIFLADHTAYSCNCYPEVYVDHGQTVFFGTHPDTKMPYRWQQGSPATRNILDLPTCTGQHIWAFMKAFSGDPKVAYKVGVSAVNSFLKFATENKIEINTADDYVRVIAAAHEGNRHHILKAAVAHALYSHLSPSVIEEKMRAPYIDLFRTSSIAVQRRRIKDFDEVLEWANRKVQRRAS